MDEFPSPEELPAIGEDLICTYRWYVSDGMLAAEDYLKGGKTKRFYMQRCRVVEHTRNGDVRVQFDCGSRILFNANFFDRIPVLQQLAETADE